MKQIIVFIISLFLGLIATGLRAQDFSPQTYWDDVDFTDTALIASKQFEDRIVDFLYQYSCCDEEEFEFKSILGAGTILAKAKANMRVYEHVLEFLLNGYTAMGKSQVVDYLLSYPQVWDGGIHVTVKELDRLDSITAPYQQVKLYAKAPDFYGITIDNEPYSIYESLAKYILVVFWSTDCEYCHDFLVKIRKHLNLKTDFELVTFALAENQEEVEAAVKKMRLPGYHFYDDLRWDSKAFLDYHVISTPTVFVLDEEKKIACKPYDWQELYGWWKEIKWLNRNNITY